MAGPRLMVSTDDLPITNAAGEGQQATPQPGFVVLDAVLILARGKWTIIRTSACALLLGLLISLALKPTYTATALIMPPQAPQSSLSSLMGQLGSLSVLGGGGLLKNPADLYVGILESRTIADQAIATFHLEKQWHARSLWETRKRLAGQVQIEASKNGLIQISAKDGDPRQASDLANFFVNSLYSVNSNLAITEAAERRMFFEREVDQEKKALAAAEDDLKQTQQKTGLLSLTGQTEQAVRSVAQVRAEIASKQVQLQGLLAYDAEENPTVIRLRDEIAAQQRQLATLQDNQQRLAPGDTQIAANQVPVGSLEYVRKLREVKYHDALYEALSRQYEAARIDEAKSAPIIQVVDRATPPDHKSGPPRLLITIAFAFLGFLASCAWLLVKALLQRANQMPTLASKLSTLREHLRFRSRAVSS